MCDPPVPVEVKLSLKIGAATTTVTVESSAGSGRDRSDDAHRRGSRPVRQASARKPIVIAQLAGDAGVAGRCGRFQRPVSRTRRSRVQFLLDRRPADHATSRARFSRIRLPVDAVQSMEVIEGAPPAEYGDKTSLVIVVTTRSGLGVTQPHGEITTSFGSFGTSNGGVESGLRRQQLGQFHFR